MPENTIKTEALNSTVEDVFADDASKETMISVENVSMVFNMANEQLNSLKEYALALAKGKLFFEAFTALDNVSFEVKRGDVYGLMGTNGSGKSTMLKIIAGVLDPTEGKCKVKGKIAPLIELGAGFDMELSARENIYLNGALLGYSKEFIQENFDDIVRFAEIEHFLDMPLKNYSSGMVARIAFAIATIIIPEVLIVDEVLAVGDFMFQKKCEDRINELITQHGVTVLIVSHSTDQIERLCNKAIWIEKGHTRMIGDASSVCQSYRIMGGRTGSPEAEKHVRKFLTTPFDFGDNSWNTTIAGDTPSETCIELCRKAWGNQAVKNVVIACTSSHVNSVFAHGLAGYLDAPILSTNTSQVSAEVRKFLEEYKPENIYISDCGECFSQNVLATLNNLEWKPQITSIAKHGRLSIYSNEAFAYGNKLGAWGKTAVFTDFENNVESIAISEFLYSNNAPLFITNDNTVENPTSVIGELKKGGIEEILIIGKTGDDEFVAMAQSEGLKVKRICGDTSADTCSQFAQFAYSENAFNKVALSAIALTQWMELQSCGCYAAKTGAALVLEETSNLDSVSQTINFIQFHANHVDSLVFLGRDSLLNQNDKELVYKTFALAKEPRS